MISAHESVEQLLKPVYDRGGELLPYIIAILFFLLLCRLFFKIVKRIKAKHNSRIETGTTNDWFKWDEFEEWKKVNQKNQS